MDSDIQDRLIGTQLYIIKKLASLPSHAVLLGYDVLKSAVLCRPEYCYVRMVRPGFEWAANLSPEDETRTSFSYNDHLFIILDSAQPPVEQKFNFMEDNELVLFNEIGKGGQAIVYLGQDFRDPKNPFVAVKQHAEPRNEKEYRRQKREIDMHTRASAHDHPCIVKLRRSFKRDERYFIVMDFHFGGDLASDLQLNIAFYFSNDIYIRNIMVQLIDAVRHLHEQHIYHW